MSIGFETVIFLFGGFLLLIGLVGGDMSYQGFRVPKVGTLPRFTTTAAGGLIMLGSLALWAVGSLTPVDSAQADPSRPPSGELLEPPPGGPAAPTLTVDEELVLAAFPQQDPSECEGSDQLPAGAVAGVICVPRPGADVVTHVSFASPQDMHAYYDVRPEGIVFAGSSCEEDVFAEGVYDQSGVESGEVRCYRRDGSSFIEWTHEATLIWSLARRNDELDLELFNWWTQAGPSVAPS